MAKQKEIADQPINFDPETGEVFEQEPVQTFNAETGETFDDQITAPPVVYTSNSFNSLMEQLDNMQEKKRLIKVKSVYYQFAPGEEMRCIFQGFSTISPQGREVKVVQLLTREHGMILQGGVGLVQQFENVPIGQLVDVVYVGKEKTSNGYMVNQFDVFLVGLMC